MAVRRRRRPRGWWANLWSGRLWGGGRVHKYKGRWYSVAPSEAYRKKRR